MLQHQNRKLRIRCGQGLGDSIYLQAVVAYLLEHGQKNLEVCTDWPDVFTHLRPRTIQTKDGRIQSYDKSGKFDIAPFSRVRIDCIAHYSGRKHVRGTSQMEDCFISAKLPPVTNPRLDWVVVNRNLVSTIRTEAGARRIVFLQHLRAPMDRADNFGSELVPSQKSIEDVLSAIRREGDTFVVKVGNGASYDSIACDLDLREKLSVCELLDVATTADMFIGQCSLIIPLSECLQIPAVIVFGSGLRTSSHSFLRSICPEKLLLRHNRNGCLELGLWDDDTNIKKAVRSWFAGLGIG